MERIELSVLGEDAWLFRTVEVIGHEDSYTFENESTVWMSTSPDDGEPELILNRA